jgi:hypothetical protein
MRVTKLALEFNIVQDKLIETIQSYKPGQYNRNSLLSEDIVEFLRTKFSSVQEKKISKKELVIQKIEKLYNKVDFKFKFSEIEKKENLGYCNIHNKYIFEINQLKLKKNKYAQLDDIEIYKLIKYKVKKVISIQKEFKKTRKELAFLNGINLNTNDNFDKTDYSTPFDNPWNKVFGEGEEANDAYWNTD